MNTIWKDQSLSAKAKLVYSALAAASGASGRFIASVQRIANGTGLSKSSVHRALAELRKGGYIDWENRYGPSGVQEPNSYHLVPLPDGVTVTPQGVTQTHTRVSERHTRGCQPDTPNSSYKEQGLTHIGTASPPRKRRGEERDEVPDFRTSGTRIVNGRYVSDYL
jgi:DNA-binding transcriptional MocR family regulator